MDTPEGEESKSTSVLERVRECDGDGWRDKPCEKGARES